MPQTPATPAQHAIDILTRDAELRVWSLIVTLFGDLARARGASLPGALLSQITGRIGIRPEAMRVALHRLRKDGWIDSRRDGRTSTYSLTETGRDATLRASRRIYAPTPETPESWHLLVAQPMAQGERQALAGKLEDAGYVTLSPGVFLGCDAAPSAPDMIAVSGTLAPVPDWVRQTLMPARLLQDYADLDRALTLVADLLGPTPGLNRLDAVTLRALIVHRWRRVLLRHADLPERFFPDGWRGTACRDRVQHLLAVLPVSDPTATARD